MSDAPSHSRQKNLWELVLITGGFCFLPLIQPLVNALQAHPEPVHSAGSPVALLYRLWQLALLWFLMLRGLPDLLARRALWAMNLGTLVRGLAGAPLLLGAALVVAMVLGLKPSGTFTQIPFPKPDSLEGLVFPLLVLPVAVAFEELLYRVYFLERLASLDVGKRPATMVSVTLFTIGHQYLGPNGLVLSAVLGLLLTLAWLRWQRFWINWLAHLGYNLAVLAIAWLLPRL